MSLQYGRRCGYTQPFSCPIMNVPLPLKGSELLIWISAVFHYHPYTGYVHQNYPTLCPANVSVSTLVFSHLNPTNNKQSKQTSWPESASELYRPSDRRLSEKLVPTFADRGCHLVSVTDSYGPILGFLDRPTNNFICYFN
jgi:hypothetical protein